MGRGIDAETAASILSKATREPFRYVGELRGGETGAHQFLGPDGRPMVVKWDTTTEGRNLRAEAVVLSERLRCEAGWPVPAEIVVDSENVTFVIQELMPGKPVDAIGHDLVDQLLDLHSRRFGLADAHDPVHWPESLITTLTVGGSGYCLHEPFRSYDERTRSLIGRIEAFGYSLSTRDFKAHDIVHWDLHPGNLLVDGGGLSAVVDTDFAMVGDAGFDFVMLALTSMSLPCEPGVKARLFVEAFDHLDERKAQAYLGHLFVRIIDWPIRRNSPAEVDFWLSKADELLTI